MGDPSEPLNTPAATSTPAPSRLGRFEIRERLGAGGFGSVYRSYDPVLDREVALKVPHPGSLQTARQVQRFLREAKASAGLHHPYIVPVFDSGTDGPHYYIASAYIPGSTLAEARAAVGMDFRRVARVVQQLAEALHYAHLHGVIHRDVKPLNVMLDVEGEPHLMDFGLARLAASNEKLTQDNAVLGTPAYMAPEQARDSSDTTPASDQYSLGVTLYELLCGLTPFSGPPQVVIYNAIHQQPPPPRTIRAEIPRDLETVCLKALSKRPEDRYPTCGDLATDLRRWLDDEPIRARRLGPVERLVRWCRREPIVAGLSATVALVLILGIAVSTYYARQATRRASDAFASEKRATEQERLANERAEEARTSADQARINAEQATREKRRADEKTADVIAHAEQLTREKAKVEALLYVPLINLAAEALNREAHVEARQWLIQAKQAGKSDGTDRAGWEWGYLDRRCRCQELGRYEPQSVSEIGFGANAGLLATGHRDGSVEVWDVATRQSRLSLKGQMGFIHGLAFSPDGGRLAVIEGENELRGGGEKAKDIVSIWDVATGGRLVTLEKFKSTSSPDRVAFSPDGTRLITYGTILGEDVHFWDPTSGRHLYLLTTGIVAMVGRVIFSPDGTRLACLAAGWPSGSDRMGIWDAAKGQLLSTLKGKEGSFEERDGPFTHAAFTPDGTRLATTSHKAVRLWDASTGRPVQSLPQAGSFRVSISPDGAHLATCVREGYECLLRIWDLASGQPCVSLKLSGRPNLLEFSPDGSRLATLDDERVLRVWDLAIDPSPLSIKELNNSICRIGFRRDGVPLAAAVNGKEGMSIFDVAKGQPLFTPDPPRTAPRGRKTPARASDRAPLTLGALKDPVTRVEFSPDGSLFATRDRENGVQIWDMASGRLRHALEDHIDDLGAIVFSPDGSRLATEEVRAVRIWDSATGKCLITTTKDTGGSRGLAFSPDGKRLAVKTSEVKSILILDAESGLPLLTIGLSDSPRSGWIAFAQGGSRLVLCSGGSASVWDAVNGQLLHSLNRDDSTVSSSAVSPDGTRLATGCRDGTVRLVDVASGQPLLTLRGHTDIVDHVEFSPDGKRLLTSDMTRTVREWDGTPR